MRGQKQNKKTQYIFNTLVHGKIQIILRKMKHYFYLWIGVVCVYKRITFLNGLIKGMFNQNLSLVTKIVSSVKKTSIFLFLLFSPWLAFNLSAQSMPVFPDSWLGVWEGELQIFSGQEVVQKVKMNVENLPTDTLDVYTWALIYGEDTLSGKRNYLLRPVDKKKGHWEIDERNSIFLDGRVVSNKFISVFSVKNNTLTSIMSVEDQNTLIFEIIIHGKESNRQTGNSVIEGENIPEVSNYPIIGYQMARLKKRN